MLLSRSVLAVVVLLFGLVCSVLSVTVRINALGDSITGSPGCWRALLWQKLQKAGVTNTAFVGTLPAQDCGFYYDGANDGHGGYLATGIANDNQLPGWLAASQPDIVMMELGTNDIWQKIPTSTVLAAFSKLVDQMRARKPSMRILVAQITPMNPENCVTCAQSVVNLNNAIPAWAASKTTSASPISVVDCWTGYDDDADTVDGVHPNDSGNQKLANAWFAPLKNAIIAASADMPVEVTTTTTSTKTTTLNGGSETSPIKAVTSSVSTADTSFVWGQCGGSGWAGATACASGSKCIYRNPWYSQCLPYRGGNYMLPDL